MIHWTNWRAPRGCFGTPSSRALAYLASLDERPVRAADADAVARRFVGDLSEHGLGGAPALARLAGGLDGTHASAGPRFFHFITGGGTPAALAADWLTSAVDQNAFSWASSPLGSQVEAAAIDWLLDLFACPRRGAVCSQPAPPWPTSPPSPPPGAGGPSSMASISTPPAEPGCRPCPSSPAATSTRAPPRPWPCSGMGRATVTRLVADAAGTLDLASLDRALPTSVGHRPS